MKYRDFKYQFSQDCELPEGKQLIVYVYRVKPTPKLLVGWFVSSTSEGKSKVRIWVDKYGEEYRK